MWKTERTHRRSWATPLLVQVGDRTELVASGAEAVVAYDPATGAELWRTDGTRSHPIPSIVAGGGLAFATAGSQRKVALAIRLGADQQQDRIAWRYDMITTRGGITSPVNLGTLYSRMGREDASATCVKCAVSASAVICEP